MKAVSRSLSLLELTVVVLLVEWLRAFGLTLFDDYRIGNRVADFMSTSWKLGDKDAR